MWSSHLWATKWLETLAGLTSSVCTDERWWPGSGNLTSLLERLRKAWPGHRPLLQMRK